MQPQLRLNRKTKSFAPKFIISNPHPVLLRIEAAVTLWSSAFEVPIVAALHKAVEPSYRRNDSGKLQKKYRQSVTKRVTLWA